MVGWRGGKSWLKRANVICGIFISEMNTVWCDVEITLTKWGYVFYIPLKYDKTLGLPRFSVDCHRSTGVILTCDGSLGSWMRYRALSSWSTQLKRLEDVGVPSASLGRLYSKVQAWPAWPFSVRDSGTRVPSSGRPSHRPGWVMNCLHRSTS